MRTGDKAPDKKQMTFLLPVALMERLRHVAQAHHRSVVGELLCAIEAYLAQHERAPRHD